MKPLDESRIAALNRAFQAASVVIASGRAAAESIAAGRPTIAVASRGYEGLVGVTNFDAALSRNLGGVATPESSYSPGRLYADIAAARTGNDPAPLIAKLRAERSLAQVDAHVREVEGILARGA